jgi:sortase A
MGKSRSTKARKSNSNVVGGRWLANLLIWAGILLMLVGGILAYPTIQSYVSPPDAQSLVFNVTAAARPTVVAAQPTPSADPVQPTPSVTASQPKVEIATPTAPPPIVLPETELVTAQETPTSPEPEVRAEEQATPEATPEPTATPVPTATPDPASLIPVRLVIPAIDLDAPVEKVGWETREVNGQLVSSWIVPDKFAAGWHATSALPGVPGNTVLNGHHNIKGEVFRDLEDLQPGDEVIIYSGETPHYYGITERLILEEKNQPQDVRQQNARFILPTEDERLTMVTCWPYTNNTHRLIIVAVPIQLTPTPTPMME